MFSPLPEMHHRSFSTLHTFLPLRGQASRGAKNICYLPIPHAISIDHPFKHAFRNGQEPEQLVVNFIELVFKSDAGMQGKLDIPPVVTIEFPPIIITFVNSDLFKKIKFEAFWIVQPVISNICRDPISFPPVDLNRYVYEMQLIMVCHPFKDQVRTDMFLTWN